MKVFQENTAIWVNILRTEAGQSCPAHCYRESLAELHLWLWISREVEQQGMAVYQTSRSIREYVKKMPNKQERKTGDMSGFRSDWYLSLRCESSCDLVNSNNIILDNKSLKFYPIMSCGIYTNIHSFIMHEV